MNWFNALLLFLLQTTTPAAKLDMPAAPGVYYHQSSGSWISLQRATVAEMKPKGMGLFIATGGYTSLEVNIICRGAEASLRISDPRPTFFVREVGSSKDVIFVRFTQKENERTLQTSSSAATVENKGGFKKGDVYKVSIAMNTDNSYSVTPEKDFKPGEYLLVFAHATAGYDFGIDPEK